MTTNSSGQDAKKVEVDSLKAPIFNFDVQLMLQTNKTS